MPNFRTDLGLPAAAPSAPLQAAHKQYVDDTITVSAAAPTEGDIPARVGAVWAVTGVAVVLRTWDEIAAAKTWDDLKTQTWDDIAANGVQL